MPGRKVTVAGGGKNVFGRTVTALSGRVTILGGIVTVLVERVSNKGARVTVVRGNVTMAGTVALAGGSVTVFARRQAPVGETAPLEGEVAVGEAVAEYREVGGATQEQALLSLTLES